jgi:predicted transcriptional regulator
MTMLSFRLEDEDAALVQAWATRLGVDRSQLLRDAVHRYLARLASEDDVAAWLASPLDAGESALADAAEWGPSEDWSDWNDAAR